MHSKQGGGAPSARQTRARGIRTKIRNEYSAEVLGGEREDDEEDEDESAEEREAEALGEERVQTSKAARRLSSALSDPSGSSCSDAPARKVQRRRESDIQLLAKTLSAPQQLPPPAAAAAAAPPRIDCPPHDFHLSEGLAILYCTRCGEIRDLKKKAS